MRLFEDPQFLKKAACVSFCVAAVFAVLAIILFFVFDIRGMIRAHREIRQIRKNKWTGKSGKIRQQKKTDKTLTSDGTGKKSSIILTMILTAALLPAVSAAHSVSRTHTSFFTGCYTEVQAAVKAEQPALSVGEQTGSTEAKSSVRNTEDGITAERAETGAVPAKKETAPPRK